jgi:heme/copper-type cytochrome/quinol oxidase subunit 2
MSKSSKKLIRKQKKKSRQEIKRIYTFLKWCRTLILLVVTMTLVFTAWQLRNLAESEPRKPNIRIIIPENLPMPGVVPKSKPKEPIAV